MTPARLVADLRPDLSSFFQYGTPMIQNLLRKMFDSSDKDVKALTPLIEDINQFESKISALSDDELRAKTDEFRERLRGGATLSQLLPEAFAVVREVSQRTLGMRQFDVQMVGGIVLHQGRIAEMKTGEGKTLVAAAPLYLNALLGKGAHLVTANDYLARRDATWMGPIYHFLGLSLGVIQGQGVDSDELGGSYIFTPGHRHDDPRYHNLVTCSRRQAYLCDITYGTNHEFGFDYLRDNMAYQVEQLSMRDLHFAIVDEVDSILIDEARTPHIISGPSNDDVSVYKEIDKIVSQLVKGEKGQEKEPGIHYTVDKKSHGVNMTEEGMDLVESLLGIENIAGDPKLFHHVIAGVKAHGLFTKDIDYVVRQGEVVIVDENTGRMMFGRRYGDGLHQALEAKENVNVQRESQTVAVITFQNLFRMYDKLAGMTGTAKTEEDEFRKIYGLDVVTVPTHRNLQRKDLEDIVFKTLEAKYRGVTREILRLFTKQQPVLVGTRSIEMSETVSDWLKPDILQKLVLVDRLVELKENKSLSGEAKKKAEEAINIKLQELPTNILSMVCAECKVSSDALSDETKSWFLKKYELPESQGEFFDEAMRHGVPHNVLNAKYHEREAVIISEAGRKGAVTIATNMAGRGVDILLGGRVADEVTTQDREAEGEMETSWNDTYADTFKHFRRGGIERAAPPLPLDDQERRGLADEVRALGGLYILGSERHESRRIDNQLRGRAGRQGDPGESKFFVSLEDYLWKIFNPNMLENPLLKAWPEMEEVKAGYLSKMIQKTQERIENHFFEARKHVLEYDDVLNAQREHIYSWRRGFLLDADAGAELKQGIHDVVQNAVNASWYIDADTGNREFDHEALFEHLNELFPLVDYATVAEVETKPVGPELTDFLEGIAMQAYHAKHEQFGEDSNHVERQIMLQAINDRWMDHLQVIEYIREGIQLRSYAQVDPLSAYKRETYDLFQNTLRGIRELSVKFFFRAMPVQREADPIESIETTLNSMVEVPSATPSGEPGAWPEAIDPNRVGRNDPCPCGSGAKFKTCHYPIFREQKII